jgi:DNA ligase-4
VLKDLDSKWEPSDRSGKWLKLKPDYIHSESDLDALIIGERVATRFYGVCCNI